MLTLRGQAQEAGALGDTISVLNPQTKRVVQGVISGPGRVTVGTIQPRICRKYGPESGRAAAAVERRE